MAERRFTARLVIGVRPEVAFDWVADHRNAPRVLEGISEWQPVGSRTRGAGARFRVTMNALGVGYETTLVLDSWDRPRGLGWRSESGLVPQRGTWRFRALGGGTEVSLEIAYEPPGGVLGGLLVARADGVVRGRLRRALDHMRQQLEAERPPS